MKYLKKGTNQTVIVLIAIFMAAFAFSGYSQSYERTIEGISYAELRDPRLSIQLFPNPAQDYLHINLGNMKAENVEFTIHNIIGNEIVVHAEKVDDHIVRIRVKEMAPGYYFLAIRNEGIRFKSAFKFIKD